MQTNNEIIDRANEYLEQARKLVNALGHEESIRTFKAYSKYSRKCVYDIPLGDALEDHQPNANLFTRIKMNNGLLYYPHIEADQYVCYYHTKHIHYPLTDQSYPTSEEAVLNAVKNWNELKKECEMDSPLKLKVFCVKEDFH